MIHEMKPLVPEADAEKAIAAADTIAAEPAVAAVFAILAPEASVAFRHIHAFVAEL